jgi:hypothetical protein
MLKELLLTMTNSMSMTDIVKNLKTESEKFVATNGTNDKQLSVMCTVYLLKEILIAEKRDSDKLLKEWEEHEKMKKMFDKNKNN